MYAASSEARNANAPATSSGSAKRPSGIRASVSGGELRVGAHGLGHRRRRQRRDRVDRDAAPGELPRRRLRQPDDRRLRGAVVGLPDRPDEPGGGGRVDDSPGAVVGQVRKRRAQHAVGAEQVHVDHRAGRRPRRGRRSIAGRMIPALLITILSAVPSSTALLDGYRRRPRLRHVRRHADRSAAGVFDLGRRPRAAASPSRSSDGDRGALSRQPRRDGRADAGARAGDERDSSRQAAHQ